MTSIVSVPLETQTQAAAKSDGSPLSVGDAPSGRTTVYEYPLATTGLAESVAATGQLVILQASHPITLQLREFDIFGGDPHVIQGVNPTNGVIETTIPYEGRTFRGAPLGESTLPASVLIAPEGLYGSIVTEGEHWSLQPSTKESPIPGTILQQIVVYRPDQPGTPIPQIAPSSVVHASGSFQLKVASYAEYAWTLAVSDYANRMATAWSEGTGMWSTETNIAVTINLFYFTNTAGNFAQGSGCGGDMGLDDFIARWTNTAYSPKTYNVWALFSYSVQGPSGTAGCSHPVNLNSNVHPDNSAAETIEAHDWYTTDTYNPNNMDHLGQGANHELTHLAGEPNHPNNYTPCYFNLMMNNVPYQCTYEYRLSSSIQLVQSYAYLYLPYA